MSTTRSRVAENFWLNILLRKISVIRSLKRVCFILTIVVDIETMRITADYV